MSDRNEKEVTNPEHSEKNNLSASIFSVLLALIASIVAIIIGIFDNEAHDSVPVLRYFFAVCSIVWFFSLLYEMFKDYEEIAAANRAHIREAEVITMFWKINTFLELRCDKFLLIHAFVHMSIWNPLNPFFKKLGINVITSIILIALQYLMMMFIYYQGKIAFAEFYLDLEYVEERRLTDEKALTKELKEIWKDKFTFKTEYRDTIIENHQNEI